MHSLRRWISLVVATLAICAAAVASAAPYSTPTIQAVDASRSSITLRVTAGSSGAPAGFVVEWTTAADYDVYGWTYGYLYTCSCWGVATWNFDAATGGSYRLAPGASQIVEFGDQFDETGLTTSYAFELDPGSEYYFRVRATGDGNGQNSAWSPSIESSTTGTGNDCTFTLGYWKNHEEAWQGVGLTLGTVNYTHAEVLSILNQPANGNGLIILCHQLIAAKLNILNGADPTPVSATIAAADAQIGALVCPPVNGSTDFIDPSLVSSKATTLDNYNNGKTSVPHCGQTPSHASSWGRVKSLYR